MDVATEIRKLPYSNVKELAIILDLNESWKNLMAIIPKKLEKNKYECQVSRTNPCKYNTDHFKLLESSSITMQKMCTELLFREWGTSEKIRPTLGHLLHLLTKAELYRAADYVAETLLKSEPPARPTEGPAAIVTISMPDVNMQDVEKELDAQKYHSSIISNLMNDTVNSVDVNLNYSSRENCNVIPKIVISEPQLHDPSTGMSLVLETRRRRMNRQNASIVDDAMNEEASDMIQFSTSQVASDTNNQSFNESVGIIPDIPAIMKSDSDNNIPTESYLPNSSILNLNSDSPTNSVLSEPTSEVLPPLTDLLEHMSTPSQDALNSGAIVPYFITLDVDQESNYIPPVSLLIGGSSTQISDDQKPPVINVIQSEGSFSMPQFSALLPDKKSFSTADSKHFLPIVDHGSDTSSYGSSKNSNASSQNSNLSQRSDLRPKCVSPLPNLSLNTPLPHFSYYVIEAATNSFDETPHKNCRQVENSLVETNGRFLGSGAFGSVFLALGIGDKPVAVKKLFLNNMDVVDVDDPVTKQFINEVEVLSRYQHENLLSIIGYSCDGPTYCLLYEFLPGGALKDRLQNTEERLIWTDRLYVALGTARAVSHLHTAYSTPLIHRDIKTANILLDCTNKPKLCDFGLIKLIPNQNTNTSTSAFGTSAYMAREAFRGDVSVKLDTYSFGVVLLELITGLPPLDEDREGCDIVTHVEEVCEDNSIDPLIDLKAGSWVTKDINFAEELYKIATKCLEQNKKKRPTMVAVTKEVAELIKQCA